MRLAARPRGPMNRRGTEIHWVVRRNQRPHGGADWFDRSRFDTYRCRALPGRTSRIDAADSLPGRVPAMDGRDDTVQPASLHRSLVDVLLAVVASRPTAGGRRGVMNRAQ